jgi:hypothetical protein
MCPGGSLTVGCDTVDGTTCSHTFHWIFTILHAEPGEYDGQVATVMTSGWGLNERYLIPVRNGRIDFMAKIRGRDYGGTESNGCYVKDATWTAYPVAIGETPTYTPVAPDFHP